MYSPLFSASFLEAKRKNVWLEPEAANGREAIND